MTSGYTKPVISVSKTTRTMAGRTSFNMTISPQISARVSTIRDRALDQMQGIDHEVDCLDADERNDDAADTVDPQIAPQQRGGADRTIGDPFQCQRNERNDDERVED